MSNFNFNRAFVGGRICKDVELKMTPSGSVPVCSFTLAVNRNVKKDGKNESVTDFIQCVAWRNTAEFIAKFFKKGNPIFVTGSIQTRKWQDKDGSNRYATELIVTEANFIDSKDDKSSSNGEYVPVEDTDTLPF